MAIRTVRWHQDEPVGDGYTQGQFAGMKCIIGRMVDRGVFDRLEALRFLREQVIEALGTSEDLHMNLTEIPGSSQQRGR